MSEIQWLAIGLIIFLSSGFHFIQKSIISSQEKLIEDLICEIGQFSGVETKVIELENRFEKFENKIINSIESCEKNISQELAQINDQIVEIKLEVQSHEI